MVRAGSLSERLWIEVRTVTTSTDIGAPTESWSTFHQTRAEVMPKAGVERFSEAREQATARRSFRIRYNPTTSPLTEATGAGTYRVRFPSSTSPAWDLEDAYPEMGRKRSIVLTCVRRT